MKVAQKAFYGNENYFATKMTCFMPENRQ